MQTADMQREEVFDLSPEPAVQLHPAAVRRELRAAAHDLRERGLTQSAAWAAEQLMGLRTDDDDASEDATPMEARGPDAGNLLLAKAHFDAKVQRGQKAPNTGVPHRFGAAAAMRSAWAPMYNGGFTLACRSTGGRRMLW